MLKTILRPAAYCFVYAISVAGPVEYSGCDSAHGLEQLEPLRRPRDR